jgi:AAA ATPase domain
VHVLPNPYTPGQVPRILAGRAEEMSLIRDRLARVEAYGELSGPLLVFHAPRGIGKTSLLREAQREAEEHGFVTAWVACARRQPLLPELVDRVGNALERAEVVTGKAAGGWRSRVQKVSLQVGPPGVQVGAEVTRGPEPDQKSVAPQAAIEDLLHDAATKVRRRGGSGLAVFVDELHAAMRADAAVLLNALQNLDGRRADNPLTVIGAGLPSTPEELTRAATFGERLSFVGLQLLDGRGSRQALVEPAEQLGVSWDDRAVAAVERTARGYPYFLQLLAHTAWQAAAPEEGGTVTAAHVRKGKPAAEQQLEAMYRARWRAATALEQELMAAMAAEAGERSEPGEEPAVARAAVAARMGRVSRAVSMPRDRLLDKGIIEPAGHGLLRFTLPGFTQYVLTQATPPE